MNSSEINILIRGYQSTIKDMQELIEHLDSKNKKYEEYLLKLGAQINSVETPEYDVCAYKPSEPLKFITQTEIQFPRMVIGYRGTKDYINGLIKEALEYKLGDKS